MKPRLLNLAAGVSVLLAVAIVAFWVCSYWRSNHLYYYFVSKSGTVSYQEIFISVQGVMDFSHDVTSARQPIPTTQRTRGFRYFSMLVDRGTDRFYDLKSGWHVLGFGYGRSTYNYPRSGPREFTWTRTTVIVPHVGVVIVLALLPAVAIARHRRRRHRDANNLCPTCGYDLRATPDRCPECGAVPTLQTPIPSPKLQALNTPQTANKKPANESCRIVSQP